MGKGAFVSIQNQSGTQVAVSYSNFVCMYQNGDDGSDFGPITGTLPAGQSLPPTGSAYIEADASILGCSTTTSTFTMNIQGGGATLAIVFTELHNVYDLSSGYVVQPPLSATTTLQPGDQYTINVIIRDHQWTGATWMQDLSSAIGPVMLKNLVIPGTHDSGTYGINPFCPIVPGQDAPVWLNAVIESGVFGRLVGVVVANWAQAQGFDFSTQLAAGIRYFDLRVILTDDYWICHSMSSIRLSDAIAQIAAFINANPKEIIILDFNHLYQMDGVGPNQPVVEMLTSAFGGKLAPGTMSPSSTVNDLLAGGHQVIALYADAPTVQQNPQLFWSESAIASPYADTDDLQALQGFLDTQLTQKSPTQLFVLQGILTPTFGTIAAGVAGTGPGSLASQANTVTPAVTGWVEGWASRGINIVIVDWYTAEPQYVDVLIAMNVRSA